MMKNAVENPRKNSVMYLILFVFPTIPVRRNTRQIVLGGIHLICKPIFNKLQNIFHCTNRYN